MLFCHNLNPMIGSLLIPSNVNAATESENTSAKIVTAASFTQIDSGYSSYRTLAPGATESFKITNSSPYARGFQLTVNSPGANHYPSYINFTGSGRFPLCRSNSDSMYVTL